jgi:hypothetical protein
MSWKSKSKYNGTSCQTGTWILSVSLVNVLGRRHQDKRSLADQMETESKKAAGSSWEQLTVMHWMVPRFCTSAAKTVLSLFHHIDVHYTYMLSHTGEENGDDNVEMDMEVDSDDEADDLEEGTMEQDENEPWFDSIL